MIGRGKVHPDITAAESKDRLAVAAIPATPVRAAVAAAAIPVPPGRAADAAIPAIPGRAADAVAVVIPAAVLGKAVPGVVANVGYVVRSRS